MARSSFAERQFNCVLCGARFAVLLAPDRVIEDPVCGDCGIRLSPGELRRRIQAEKARRDRR